MNRSAVHPSVESPTTFAALVASVEDFAAAVDSQSLECLDVLGPLQDKVESMRSVSNLRELMYAVQFVSAVDRNRKRLLATLLLSTTCRDDVLALHSKDTKGQMTYREFCEKLLNK